METKKESHDPTHSKDHLAPPSADGPSDKAERKAEPRHEQGSTQRASGEATPLIEPEQARPASRVGAKSHDDDADSAEARERADSSRVEAKPAEKVKIAPKNKVRKLRLERMMSKAELARRANVSTLTIDRIERGLSCRMDTKRKILEALGLKPSDRLMVFGEED